jgi:hypothetical protein
MQFAVYLEETEPLGAEQTLINMTIDELVQRFSSWRVKVNDLTSYDKAGLANMFRHAVQTARVSQRINGKPVKVRVITGLKQDTLDLLAATKEEEDASTTVVDD